MTNRTCFIRIATLFLKPACGSNWDHLSHLGPSAAILGLAIGLITSVLVTAQFYLFLELPLVFSPPYILMAITLTVAVSTTYFAVLIPIAEVNNKRIAVVLKSNA